MIQTGSPAKGIVSDKKNSDQNASKWIINECILLQFPTQNISLFYENDHCARNQMIVQWSLDLYTELPEDFALFSGVSKCM